LAQPAAPGVFGALLEKRKGSLAEQRHQLELAKQKLQQDIHNLRESKQKLDAQEDDLVRLGEQLQKVARGDGRPTEHIHRSMVLRKTEADLKQQLQIAETELEEAETRVKVNRDDLDKSTLASLKRELHEKMIVVQTLRNLVLTMNSDIVTRENEVFEQELRAQEKQKLLDAAHQEEEELMERRRVADEAKRTLLASIQRIEQTNQKLLEEKVAIQTQLDSALSEKARLAVLSAELAEREEALERKVQELQSKKKLLEQFRLNRFEEELRAKLGRNATKLIVAEEEEEEEEAIGDEGDLIAIEYEIEQEERTLRERIRELEIKRQKGVAFWTAKIESLEKMNESLSQQLSSMPFLEDIQGQIKAQREANQGIEQEIQAKKQEVQELEGQLQSPDALYQQRRDVEKEQEKATRLEQQLRDELENLESDEKAVQAQEERMKQTRQDIEEEKQRILATDVANRKLMDILTAQLKTAQEQLGPSRRANVQSVDT
jgi:hypothetical protein